MTHPDDSTEQEQSSAPTRASLSRLELLLLVGLLGLTVGAFGVEQTHTGQKEIIALVFVALPLVLAGLVFAHIRWIPTVAAGLAALYFLGAITTSGELSNLTHVAASWPFAAIVVELLSCVLVVFAGLGATVQYKVRHAG
jgi:hypothetical protein